MGVKLLSSGGGSVEVVAPATASAYIVTMPASTGTVLTTTSPKAGNVVQVVSVTTTLSFSSTSSVFSSIGLTASITPTSATNKILVIAQYPIGAQSSNIAIATALYRDASAVLTFNAQYGAATGYLATTPAINYLDSPATVSSTAYTIYARLQAGAGTISCSEPAVITLMEIAA